MTVRLIFSEGCSAAACSAVQAGQALGLVPLEPGRPHLDAKDRLRPVGRGALHTACTAGIVHMTCFAPFLQ